MRVQEILKGSTKSYKFTVNIPGVGKKEYYTDTREEGQGIASLLLGGVA